MDNATVAILCRTLITLVLIWVASKIGLLGYKLFQSGAGLGPSHLVVDLWGFKATASSVGSVTMLLACLWIWPVMKAFPNYEMKSPQGTTQVSSLDNTFSIPDIEIRPTASLASVMSDPEALRSHLRKAMVEANANRENHPKLDGQPAQYVADSTSVNAFRDGTYFLKTQVKAAGSLAEVDFAVEAHNDKITFRPCRASWLVSPNRDPNSVRLPGGNGGSGSSTPEPLPMPDKNQEFNSDNPAPLPMPDENGKSNTPKPSPFPFGG